MISFPKYVRTSVHQHSFSLIMASQPRIALRLMNGGAYNPSRVTDHLLSAGGVTQVVQKNVREVEFLTEVDTNERLEGMTVAKFRKCFQRAKVERYMLTLHQVRSYGALSSSRLSRVSLLSHQFTRINLALSRFPRKLLCSCGRRIRFAFEIKA